jgi:hypothetical protein
MLAFRQTEKGRTWMKEHDPKNIDRLSIRERPEGFPIMRQNWGKLLFMHWRISPDLLRPLIPERLTIDTFEGEAWIAITPFTMWGVRASFLPPVPGLSEMHELNVRTYVHLDGVPGVWFFSLDINSSMAAAAARTFYFLPYFDASINLRQENQTIFYDAHRTQRDAHSADFNATYTSREPLPESEPGSLAFFLTERYCLYSFHKDNLYRARIHHAPWPLRTADVSSYRSTMLASHGLPEPTAEPLLHYAEALEVDIWPINKM